MTRWVAAMIFLLLTPLARAEGGDPIRVCFAASSSKWVALPDGFPDSELDVLEDVDGRYKAVVVDLRGDGGQAYFFPTACGNGGCDFPVFDCRSNRLLGNVFGSPVCIMRETVNGMPVLRTYTHAGPSAKIVRYVFGGKKYQVESSVELEGEEHDAVKGFDVKRTDIHGGGVEVDAPELGLSLVFVRYETCSGFDGKIPKD